MEPRISFRVQAKAGRTAIAKEYAHDTRTGHIPDYVDQRRSHLNSHICLSSYGETPEAIIKESNRRRKTKKTARTSEMYAGVVTFSQEAQKIVEPLPIADQNRLFQTVVERVAAAMDLPVAYIAVHRDESAIHAHFALINVTSRGRLFRSPRNFMAHLQDIAGEACQELGYDIRRGVPKKAWVQAGADPSKWIHRSVAKLHEDLPAEIAAKEAELDDVAVGLAITRELSEKSVAKMELQRLVARDAATSALREWQTMADRCDSLRAEVDSLGAQIDGRKTTLKIIEPILQARESRAEGLCQEMIDLEKDRDLLRATIAAQEATIAKNDDVIAQQTSTQNNLTATIATAEQQLRKYERLLAAAENKLAQLSAETTTASAEIKRVEKLIGVYEHRIAAHKEQLDEYPRFVRLYKTMVAENMTLKAKIAQLEEPAQVIPAPRRRPTAGPGR